MRVCISMRYLASPAALTSRDAGACPRLSRLTIVPRNPHTNANTHTRGGKGSHQQQSQ